MAASTLLWWQQRHAPCPVDPIKAAACGAAAPDQRLAVVRRLGGVRDGPFLRLYLGPPILLRSAASAGVKEQPQSQHRRCQCEQRKNPE